MKKNGYKILIIDDHPERPNLTKIYRDAIKGDEKNYDPDPDIIRSPEQVTPEAAEAADIILLDWNFENSSHKGGRVLQDIEYWRKQGNRIHAKIVILSDIEMFYKEWERPLAELSKCVTDFSVKGVIKDKPPILKWQMDKALDIINTAETIHNLKESVEQHFIRQSSVMRDIFDLVVTVARNESNVLITGESGTGKEEVAKAIHRISHRRRENFVVLNCAGLPDTLLESELFGYKKGAFTGAKADKLGFCQLADKGTLFLDEVGDLSSSSQAKVLRVLADKSFYPVGGTAPVQSDFRLLTATNNDLKQMIEEGIFRKDLYYRIKVYEIHLPALRERREDIRPLAEHFIEKHGRDKQTQHQKECSINCEVISPEAMKALEGYFWPGNVRELENFIERGVGLLKSEEKVLELHHFPEEILKGYTENKGPCEKHRENQIFDCGLDANRSAHDIVEDHYKAESEFLDIHTNTDLDFLKDNYPNKIKTEDNKKKWKSLFANYKSKRNFLLKGRERSPKEKIEIANRVVQLMRDKGFKFHNKWNIAMILGLSDGELTSVERSSKQRVEFRI